MNEKLASLQAHIGTLKAAPMWNKAALAEKTLDAALAVLVEMQQEINQLKQEQINHEKQTGSNE